MPSRQATSSCSPMRPRGLTSEAARASVRSGNSSARWSPRWMDWARRCRQHGALDYGVEDFLEAVAEDARKTLGLVRLVNSRPGISSMLIDNVNGSIHLRALADGPVCRFRSFHGWAGNLASCPGAGLRSPIRRYKADTALAALDASPTSTALSLFRPPLRSAGAFTRQESLVD